MTVTYDESGRVTQASGGDPNALRIARQKRFPPGKGWIGDSYDPDQLKNGLAADERR